MKTETRNLLITGLALWVLIIVGLLVTVVIRLTGRASSDGPPPDLSDFETVRPTIPGTTDEESILASDKNAYSHLMAAIQAAYFPPEAFRTLLTPEDEANNQAMIEDLVVNNARTYELVAEGLQCDVLLMTPKVSLADDDAPSPVLGGSLRQLLTYKVDIELKNREYTEAVNTCNMLLKFGQLWQTAPDGSIYFMVGEDLQIRALHRIRELAHVPELPDSVLASLCDRFSTAKEINDSFEYAFKTDCRQLIAALNDFAPQFFKTVRTGKAPDDMSNSNPDSRARIRLPNPVGWRFAFRAFQFNNTKALAADMFREMLRCTSVPLTEIRFERMDRLFDEMYQKEGVRLLFMPNIVGKMLLGGMYPAYKRTPSEKYRIEADFIMTRTVVACVRYERRYGKWPESLDALVPEFLDAAPIDPFDGKPLRYDPARGVIYSINRDLIDSGGSTKSLRHPEEPEPVEPWHAEDAVYSIHEELTTPNAAVTPAPQ